MADLYFIKEIMSQFSNSDKTCSFWVSEQIDLSLMALECIQESFLTKQNVFLYPINLQKNQSLIDIKDEEIKNLRRTNPLRKNFTNKNLNIQETKILIEILYRFCQKEHLKIYTLCLEHRTKPIETTKPTFLQKFLQNFKKKILLLMDLKSTEKHFPQKEIEEKLDYLAIKLLYQLDLSTELEGFETLCSIILMES